ncbi:hypothetical protein SNE40_006563 [Patella caerulea]|uniref:Pescadillo homolog n=1 Tax=Patella caerulea TaxID=87958 RepID=A0AAN8Q174_PATCE
MKRKRKYESGAATAFITRNQALRKLQLSLKDFRQLCILKGIYPQEPQKLKQATKGSGITRTFYFVKDINYLSHEPLIVKFRQTKRFMKRLTKAVHKKNDDAVARIKASRPKYKLDHIVKERYPSFIDAVRDLDDCLTMCFLFATLPTSFSVKNRSVQLCRRLTVEFQHFVITSQALRKVFISIKGIYYQAEIMGQTITWIVPHKVGYQQPSDIDFKIMRTFVDFYTTLLGFTNFRLYHSLNLHYPPQLQLAGEKDETETKCLKSEATEERLAAMTQTLKSMVTDNIEDAEVDEFPVGNPDDPDFIEKAKLESEKLNQFQNLFKGKKFFLNREIPRESVTFIIRSFGGEVSWDKSLAVGATYQESDESITHQIVDRPSVEKQFLSRYYIQPQWIFDCVNSQMLIPVEDYFPGVELPPHLSPFVKEKEGDYVPAERKQQIRRQQGIDSGVEEDDGLMDDDDDDDDEDEEEEAVEEEDDDEEEEEEEEEEDDSDENSDDEEEETPKKSKKAVKKPVKTPKPAKKPKDMAVTPGSVEKVNLNRKVQQQEKEEKRLAEMMIPKKKKRLYQTIVKSQTRRDTKIQQLKEKRKVINRRNKLAKAGGE